KDPNFVEAYAGRANADWSLNNFTGSYDDLSKALEFTKDQNERAFLLVRRGEILAYLNKTDDAARDFVEAAKSSTSDTRASAINGIGIMKLMKHDWIGAESEFRAAAQIKPDRANGFIENIGIIYLQKGQWKEAVEFSVKLRNSADKSGGWMLMIEALADE